MGTICTINASVRSGGPYKSRTLNGREFWVVPFVSLVEGVLNGSKGPLYYPGEEISKNPGIWNGTLLTNGHPVVGGQPVSGRTPETLESHGLGYVFNDWIEPTRRGGDAYFDKGWTKNKAPAVARALENGELIELSTGVGTTDYMTNASVDKRGRAYNKIARDYQPDHLAVLSSQRGACSIVDGCGIGRNAEGGGKACPECGSEMDAEGKCESCGYTLNKGMTVQPEELDPELVEEAAKQNWLTKVLNALWPGQTRSAVTGRLKPVGSGTGDPAIRMPAQAGFFAVSPDASDIELGANPTWVADQVLWEKALGIAKEQGRPEDSAYTAAVYRSMGGTRTTNVTGDNMADTRAENVKLLLNCDCWKNKAGVLNDAALFTDQQVADLVATNATITTLREKLKVNSLSEVHTYVTTNAFPPAEEEEEEEEEETMNKGGKAAAQNSEQLAADVAANMLKNPATLNALSKAMFGRTVEEVQAGLDYGARNADARKAAVVDQLLVALPEASRAARRVHYQKLSLNELNDRLQDMVAAGTLVEPVRNRVTYGGTLDVADDSSRADNAGADETFDIVAMNWDAPSAK